MRISYRQGLRLYSAYIKEGDAGLMHGNNGRRSNNRTDEAILDAALKACRNRCSDFGPAFAAEKMAEDDGIKIGASVLRRLLIETGGWQGTRRTKEYRSRRERKEHFGEMVQFDGSHRGRFEGCGDRCCLITMIDDAANIRLSGFFEEETVAGIIEVFSLRIRAYGMPESLYCDKKNAFALTREASDAELLAGITKPKSRFGRACDKLGVEVIAAHSHQAKGRVERSHEVDQDRLVSPTVLAQNCVWPEYQLLPKPTGFGENLLAKMNRKFSRPAAKPQNAHVPPGNVDLKPACFKSSKPKRRFQSLRTKQPYESLWTKHWKETKLLVEEITNAQGQKVLKAT